MSHTIRDDQEVVIEAPSIVFRRGDGTENARMKSDGSGTGWPNVLGGSITYVHPAGSGDDATNLTAALPDVGLRADTTKYLIPSGWTVNQAARVEGRGMGAITINGVTAGSDWQDGLSQLNCATDATDGLVLTAKGQICDKFGVRYTGGSAATSGAGIRATSANGLRLRDVSIKDFYNCLKLDTINNYVCDGLLICDPVNYGIYVTGTDQGDGMIRNSFLLSGPTRNGASALRWEGGGGVQMSGIKTNSVNNKPWVNALDLVPTFATTEISVADSVIDGYTGIGVNVDGTTQTVSSVFFEDVKVRSSSNPTNAYKINHANVVAIQGGLVECGTNCLTAFDIANVNQLTIDGVQVRGVPQTVPIVTLASTVNSATVKLGNIGPPGVSGGVTWSSGSVYLLSLGQNQGYQDGGHGDFTFTWKAPAFNSTAVYKTLWQLFMNGGCAVEFSMFASITGVTPYWVCRQQRLAINNSGAINLTTLGTDTATSTDIDIQWRVSGKNLYIEAKLDAGSVGTNVPIAFSTVRVVGVPNQLYAYS